MNMKMAAMTPLAVVAFLQGAPRTANAFSTRINLPLSLSQSSSSTAFMHEKNSHRGASVPARPATPTTTALPSSLTDPDSDPYLSPRLDADALAKYALAAATELALLGAACALLDLASARLGAPVPFPAAAGLFYAASLKSRACSPLNNRRPDRPGAAGEAEGGTASPGFRDRVMPAWTPPGIVFPIMWVLIVGPIRAYAGALVVASTGHFLTLPTMLFLLHLTVGDVWNTVNNAEKRYGAAVVGVALVVLTAAGAASQYATVDPLAGQLLGGTCVWLVTAAALIADTWRLNPAANGARAPLYPVEGEAETSFVWFQKAEDDA